MRLTTSLLETSYTIQIKDVSGASFLFFLLLPFLIWMWVWWIDTSQPSPCHYLCWLLKGRSLKGWTDLGLALQSLYPSTTFRRSKDPISFSHHTDATYCKLIPGAHNAPRTDNCWLERKNRIWRWSQAWRSLKWLPYMFWPRFCCLKINMRHSAYASLCQDERSYKPLSETHRL